MLSLYFLCGLGIRGCLLVNFRTGWFLTSTKIPTVYRKLTVFKCSKL